MIVKLFLRAFVLIILLMTLIARAHAEVSASVEKQFLKANQAYESGNYSEAVSAYQRLIDMGIVHPDIHYNLGNAYYKAGSLGYAISHYLRAQKYSPRDPDLNYNLSLLQAQVKDQVPQSEEGVIIPWVIRFHKAFSATEQARAEVTLFLLLFILMATWLCLPHRTPQLRPVVIGLAFLWLLLAGSAITRVRAEILQQGVVVTAEADVRSGPSESHTVRFTVHEGAQFFLEQERIDWYQVRMAGGLMGWIPKRDVVTF